MLGLDNSVQSHLVRPHWIRLGRDVMLSLTFHWTMVSTLTIGPDRRTGQTTVRPDRRTGQTTSAAMTGGNSVSYCVQSQLRSPG